MPSVDEAQRDRRPRRADYQPACPAEEFIVPLLRDRIEHSLRVDLRPTPRVILDVGCGRQPFRHLFEGPGSRYVSLDVVQNADGRVDVLAAIDGALPQKLLLLGPFDFILCTEVLEHVADWHTAFANLAALLRAGGRALLTCPHFYHLHEEPFDFWRPTLHAIDHYARGSGMKVVRREAAGDGWDVLGTLLASCIATPRRPGTFTRLRCKAINACRRLILALLRRRCPQRCASLPGVYLSNVVVLEKP